MAERLLTREFALKAVVAFVVIVAGVAAGLGIGAKLGFGSRQSNFDADKELSQLLRPGKSFPHIMVKDSSGAAVDLASVVGGERQVVAFVSPTCGPCQSLVTFLEQAPSIKNGTFRVALVTTNPDAFPHFFGATLFSVYSSTLDSADIKLFPTMVGLEQGKIVYAKATFDPNQKPKFFDSKTF